MIDKEDIAHALSFLCRYIGHSPFFYSVGLHSLICMFEARNRNLSPRIQLACLLHDASEAYLSDIYRSFKFFLDDYQYFEWTIQNLIYKRFGLGDLTKEERACVKEIDDAVLRYEMKKLFGHEETVWASDKSSVSQNYNLKVSRKVVKQSFLDELNLLTAVN